MIDKLIYAQNGVHQCWSCKNMIGRAEYKMCIRDTESIEREIICVLPTCKVRDMHMTVLYETPCSKYSYWNEKREG